MKRTLLLAVLALVLVAMPAFASVQNVKVSGDIDSTWVGRNQFDLGGGIANTREQNFFLTQTKLRVDADLTDKVSATVELLNERAWGQSAATTTTTVGTGEDAVDITTTGDNPNEVDINLAYVTIKEMLYSPLTVIVGRQAFKYGNGLVIDSSGPNNTTTGMLNGIANDMSKKTGLDAIRAILDYDPLTIDLVYAKLDAQGLTGAVADQKDDIDLMGVNAAWKLGDSYDTTLEGYFWAKVDRSDLSGTAQPKTDTIYVPGVRATANLLEGLMTSAEVALQRGTDSDADSETASKRQALAWQVIANYALPFEQTKDISPVLTTAVTYVSGDKDGAYNQGPGALGAKNTAWDPLLESQGTGKIYNTLFNFSNAYIATVRGTITPIQDVTAAIEWNGLWLDKQVSLMQINQPDLSSGTTIKHKLPKR